MREGSKHLIILKKTRLDLSSIEVEGACDVTNPLCGKEGATYVFGPQKKVKRSRKDRSGNEALCENNE